LYNYFTYLLMLCGALLLYRGVLTGCVVPADGDMQADCAAQADGDVLTDYGMPANGAAQANTRKRVRCLAAAGLCLGANVAVRMPNVVQMAFIVVVWYGAALVKANRSRVVRDTLWCILGYAVGFGLPLAAICFKYGVSAYPDMVKTMFAMTDTAADYKPVSMLTGMFGDYAVGLYWLVFAVVCMAAGFVLWKVQENVFQSRRAAELGCRLAYVALLLVLLRFYWGRGVFSFRYYEYSSIYYPAVLLLLVGVLMAVVCLFQKKARTEQKVLALIVLVQIFVTPLGSNNALYPIINNLFLVLPFMLWMACDWRQTKTVAFAGQIDDDVAADVGGRAHGSEKWSFVWQVPFVILVAFVCVQSIGFHMNFVFQDGMQGEERAVCISTPAKAVHVCTGEDNGEMLEELAAFVETEGLTGRAILTYGDLPGLGYLLDMPPALSTFWCDLDSYRMVEYARDMAQLENAIAQDTTGAAPVIILSSETAAYLSEDADAMNWFGVDRDALAADEKLQILGAFMTKYEYQEQFANGRYAVYECVTDAD
jgi:hypothetical protein